MNRNTTQYGLFLAVLLVVFGLAVWVARPFYIAAYKHEQARNRLNDELGPPYAIKLLDDNTLREIEQRWVCRSRNTETFAEVFATLDVEPTLASLIEFMNYRIPRMSLIDLSANKRNAVIAELQSTVMPISRDHAIHISQAQRKAVVYPKDGFAFVYSEGENQFEEALYAQGKEGIEPADAMDSR
jgi:hypothetical protein